MEEVLFPRYQICSEPQWYLILVVKDFMNLLLWSAHAFLIPFQDVHNFLIVN